MVAARVPVYLEHGQKRIFACALDWPGWCRSGRDELAAVDALGAYAARYADVAAQAGLRFGAPFDFDVVERLKGSATTDFGAPGAIPDSDSRPLSTADARRQAAIVDAAWAVLARVAADAPAALRKGPRGGGRDRDQVIQHVLGAETAYARKLGVRHREPNIGDVAAVAALRSDLLGVLRAARSGTPAIENGWPPRYGARRIAWHALDHAWEIQDRSNG